MDLDRREFLKKTAVYAAPVIITASVRPLAAGSPYADSPSSHREHGDTWWEELVEQIEEI